MPGLIKKKTIIQENPLRNKIPHMNSDFPIRLIPQTFLPDNLKDQHPLKK